MLGYQKPLNKKTVLSLQIYLLQEKLICWKVRSNKNYESAFFYQIVAWYP